VGRTPHITSDSSHMVTMLRMGRQQQRRRQQRRQQAREQSSSGATPARRRTEPPRRRKSSIPWGMITGVGILLLVAAGLVYAYVNQPKAAAGPPTPIPTAGPGTIQSLAPVIDGVACPATEALVYHIHQYVRLYDHGKQVQLPYSIGMPGGEASARCFYWIHVHQAYPNVIHVESPIRKTFTFGNFLDIWKATKSDTTPPGDSYVLKLEAAAAKGQVTTYVNGKPWTKGYRAIPLKSHAVITVEIGKPVVPPRPFTAWNGL
jgi:hypothetical protein